MSENDHNPLSGTKYEKANIYQSNRFLEANKIVDEENDSAISVAQRGLSINESRLFFITLLEMIPQLQKDKDREETSKPFDMIKIPAPIIISIFGNKGYYSILKKAALSLFNLKVQIKESVNEKGEESIHVKRIFDEMKFGPEYGGLVFRFAEAMRPELYELNEQYTKIAGKTIFALNSTVGIRLLELMLQYQNIKQFKGTGVIKRSFSLDSFREFFGLENLKTYSLPGKIKEKIIIPAMRDINETTTYNIEVEDLYEFNKDTGRNRIGGFIFSMSPKSNVVNLSEEEVSVSRIYEEKTQKKEPIAVDNWAYSLEDKLRSYGVGRNIARKLVKEYDEKRILNNIQYSLSMKNVMNLGAYVRKAIENDYYQASLDQISLFESERINIESPRDNLDNYLKDLELTKGERLEILYDLTCDKHKLSNKTMDILNKYKIDAFTVEEAYRMNDMTRIIRY